MRDAIINIHTLYNAPLSPSPDLLLSSVIKDVLG